MVVHLGEPGAPHLPLTLAERPVQFREHLLCTGEICAQEETRFAARGQGLGEAYEFEHRRGFGELSQAV